MRAAVLDIASSLSAATTAVTAAAATGIARAGTARAGIVGALIAVAGIACAPADSGRAVQRTDDNGVEVVTSTRPAWEEGRGWTLSATPDLVIGEDTDELEYVFQSVGGPVSLPDGRIVAGDSNRRLARRAGRPGRPAHHRDRPRLRPRRLSRRARRAIGAALRAATLAWLESIRWR